MHGRVNPLMNRKVVVIFGAVTSLYTRRLLQRETLYAEKSLHSGAFTQRSLSYTKEIHTQEVLHRSVYGALKLLHSAAFTHRGFYTKNAFTQKFLHAGAFAKETFTQESFYTQKLLHREACYTEKSYTAELLRTDGFAQISLYTEEFLHTIFFTRNKMKPTNPNAHTYVNGTDVKTLGYAVTHNTFLQSFI